MWPFGGRFFPGTNLQDLNLDWLVQRVRDLSRGIIAPFINSVNQHWMVWDTDAETFVDSGVSAAGEGTGPQGEPGKSPIIGSNGNWYTWDNATQAYSDTGIRAQGQTGPEGPEGPAGPRAGSNLLINWYFPDPVNQRGQTAWQNAGEYTIDRWKLTAGSASLTVDGIMLNGTMTQVLEHAVNLPVTASALASDGTMLTPTFTPSTRTFSITASGKTIVACKLEVGSAQTLAHQESGAWVLNEMPDYGEELRKCQRYLFVLNPGRTYAPAAVGQTDSQGRGLVMLPLPVTMVKAPTVSYSGTLAMLVGGAVKTVTDITAVASGFSNAGFMLTVTTENTDPGLPCLLRAQGDASANIILSAE